MRPPCSRDASFPLPHVAAPRQDYTYTVDASDEKANLHFEVQPQAACRAEPLWRHGWAEFMLCGTRCKTSQTSCAWTFLACTLWRASSRPGGKRWAAATCTASTTSTAGARAGPGLSSAACLSLPYPRLLAGGVPLLVTGCMRLRRSISYQEVEATTYYVMVRCQGEPVPFLIRASKSDAPPPPLPPRPFPSPSPSPPARARPSASVRSQHTRTYLLATITSTASHPHLAVQATLIA